MRRAAVDDHLQLPIPRAADRLGRAPNLPFSAREVFEEGIARVLDVVRRALRRLAPRWPDAEGTGIPETERLFLAAGHQEAAVARQPDSLRTALRLIVMAAPEDLVIEDPDGIAWAPLSSPVAVIAPIDVDERRAGVRHKERPAPVG